MARMSDSERAAFVADSNKQMEAHRKAMEPTIMGSIREGAKVALGRAAKLVGSGGMAAKAREQIKTNKSNMANEIERQTE